jgi:hypothetical protein
VALQALPTPPEKGPKEQVDGESGRHAGSDVLDARKADVVSKIGRPNKE